MDRSTFYSAAAVGAGLLAFSLVRSRSHLKPGQVAVITGGSRGLGLAMARRFGRAGLKLVLAARNLAELESANADLLASGDADDVFVVAVDLTDPAQVLRLIEETLGRFGRLDVLINNAGIIEVGAMQDQPLEAYERAMQTNFFAALHTTYAALPHLAASKGAIVNIASLGGKIPVPHMAPYVAAKFALVGFSETLHAELWRTGIRVTTVCPGLMRTGGEAHAIFVGQQEKEKRWFNLGAKTPGLAASVESAAAKILRAVDAGRAEITITPQAWLAARIHGLAPEFSQQVAALANRFVLPDPVAKR